MSSIKKKKGEKAQRKQNTSKKGKQIVSQSQMNSGNIGREVGDEKQTLPGNDKNTSDKNLPNESGYAENEERHWTGGFGQKSSDDTTSNKIETQKHPKRGYNHVDNIGGTSQEDIGERADTNDYTSDEDDENGYGL